MGVAGLAAATRKAEKFLPTLSRPFYPSLLPRSIQTSQRQQQLASDHIYLTDYLDRRCLAESTRIERKPRATSWPGCSSWTGSRSIQQERLWSRRQPAKRRVKESWRGRSW